VIDADSGPAFWGVLAAGASPAAFSPASSPRRRPQTICQLGTNPTSWIIRLSYELRGAQASMHRAVTIARVLAALPPNQKDHSDD
jgi:hypothetical protein